MQLEAMKLRAGFGISSAQICLLLMSACGSTGYLGDEPLVQGNVVHVKRSDGRVIPWSRGTGFAVAASVYFGTSQQSVMVEPSPIDAGGAFRLQLLGKAELGPHPKSQRRFKPAEPAACASFPTVNPPTLAIAELQLGLRGPGADEIFGLTALPNHQVEFIYSDVDGDVSGRLACGGPSRDSLTTEFDWNLRAGWNVVVTSLPLPASLTMETPPELRTTSRSEAIPSDAVWHTWE